MLHLIHFAVMKKIRFYMQESNVFLLYLLNLFIFCVLSFWLHTCLCTACVPGAQGDQNSALYSLKVELAPCVWLGIEHYVLWKSSQCF